MTIDQRDCTCFFSILVKWHLQIGFYIELEKSANESFHCFHPKVLDPTFMPFPSRLLSIEQVENTLHVMNSTCDNGAGCNYLHLSIGKFSNLVKISSTLQIQKANQIHKSDNIDIEQMMNNFKESNDISFISFSDVSICSKDVNLTMLRI
jgi:hypothetical protein